MSVKASKGSEVDIGGPFQDDSPLLHMYLYLIVIPTQANVHNACLRIRFKLEEAPACRTSKFVLPLDPHLQIASSHRGR
jgi:hypothetical protein